MLKPLLLLPVVFILGYHPAILSASDPQASSQAPASGAAKTPSKPGNEPLARAKKLYEMDCLICHGAAGDGKGEIGKDMQLSDFTDPKALQSKTDDQLFDLIRKGSTKGKDTMPPEEPGRAKDDDVKALIHYIRNMSKNQPSSPGATPAPPPAVSSPGTN